MNLGFRHALWALGALGAAACGSRSGLYGPAAGDETGGGGAGGTTTSSTTTATGGGTTTSEGGGGEGGGGGPTGPCAVLEHQTPFATLQGGMMSHQRSPKLAYSRDDGSRVTVGSTWQFVNNPNPPIELRRTSLEPWITFPAGAGLGPTNLIDLDGGASYAIAQAPGDRFALLFADFKQPPAGGLRFSADFDPSKSMVPDTTLVDTDAQRALFLARGPTRFAYGAARQTGTTHEIRTGLIGGGMVLVDFVLGCASAAPVADAVAQPGGAFLVAIASGTDPSAGGCDFGVPGAPTRLQIGRIEELSLVSLFDLGSSATAITDMRLAPRPDGAWLAWSLDQGGGAAPVLVVDRLDTDGALVSEFHLGMAYQPGSVAIASFDDHLMVAWIEAVGGVTQPRVQMFDSDGTPRGAVTIEGLGAAQGQLSLLAAPSARQAVLAWSEALGPSEPSDQIRLTRVDCVDK